MTSIITKEPVIPTSLTGIPKTFLDNFPSGDISIYQSTHSLFCVEQKYGESRPVFEHLLVGEPPYELSLPYAKFRVSVFQNYSELKHRLVSSSPHIILIADVMMRNPNRKIPKGTRATILQTIKEIEREENINREQIEAGFHYGLQEMVHELSSLTENTNILTFIPLVQDYEKGLLEHLRNNYPMMIIESLYHPLFHNKDGSYLYPPYGDTHSTKYICEQLGNMLSNDVQ